MLELFGIAKHLSLSACQPSAEAGAGPVAETHTHRIVLFGLVDEGEGPVAVKDRRLGTDRRRSHQRTVVVSDVKYATVYLVRHALAGIERATCSTLEHLECSY